MESAPVRDLEHGDLWFPGELEIRQRGRILAGSFPYGRTATRSDRGRVRKERFSKRAFRFALRDPRREINLLFGHSFDRPLASRSAGTLRLTETDDALSFEATLPPLDRQPTHVRDARLSVQSGLSTGLSPGFQVPPRAVVPDAEIEIPEPGNPGVFIRQINHAVLYEISIVTRAVYAGAFVEARAEDFCEPECEPFCEPHPERVRFWL